MFGSSQRGLASAPPLSCSRTSRRGRGGGETLVRALVDTMAIFPTYYQPARRVASGPSCHPLCARIKNRKKTAPTVQFDVIPGHAPFSMRKSHLTTGIRMNA